MSEITGSKTMEQKESTERIRKNANEESHRQPQRFLSGSRRLNRRGGGEGKEDYV